MKKIISIVILATVLFSGISFVQAKKDQPEGSKIIDLQDAVPEEDGVYDVPGHPGLKVKVFVYKAKKRKPTPPLPPATTEPECGLQDGNSNAAIGWAGWKLPSTWNYRLNTSSVPASVGSENLGDIAKRAFDVWSTASGVIFNMTGATSINRARYDGQNIITWGRTSGSALGVTYTMYYPSSGEVVEVDTIMNQKFPWNWVDQQNLPEGKSNCAYMDSYDAQDILTHELGHWMGLNDHYTSDYVNNTMYGFGSKGEMKKNTLTAGDIAGIANIYGAH
jgi:hypothetical protein